MATVDPAGGEGGFTVSPTRETPRRARSVVALRPPPWEWSFAEDGALALDPHPVPRARPRPARRGRHGRPLKARLRSVSVAEMPQPAGRVLPARRRPEAAVRRARGVAALALVAAVVSVTLLVTAFAPSAPPAMTATEPAPAQRLLPAGPPRPQVVALHGSLRIQLPVNQRRVTAIAYHAGAEGSLPLEPVGRQANQGLVRRLLRRLFGEQSGGLRYYQLDGGTRTLAVGAPPGTDVFAPVDGTVVGLTDYVLRGRKLGVRLDIQASAAPSIVVSVTHLRPDPALSVGSAVAAVTTKIGTVLDFSSVERQTLARYTQDKGNHVALELHSATALAIP